MSITKEEADLIKNKLNKRNEAIKKNINNNSLIEEYKDYMKKLNIPII